MGHAFSADKDDKGNLSIQTDKDDKGNLSIQFIPPIHYTQVEVEAGNKLVAVLNNPDLSDADKKSQAWDILNNRAS